MPRRYTRKNKTLNARKKRGGRRARKGRGKYSKIQNVVIRQPGVVCADRQWVKLHYVDQTSSAIGNNGAQFGYLRYRSSVFDPDPLILSSGVPGFKEMSQLYRAYRVHGMKLTLRMVNMEFFPVCVVVWPSTYDVAALVSGPAYLQSIVGNAYAKYLVFSPTTGMDRQTLTVYMSTKKLIGSKMVNLDDSYQALVNTNPQQMWYWNVAVYSLAGQTFTAQRGVQFEARLTFYTEFYDRQIFQA